MHLQYMLYIHIYYIIARRISKTATLTVEIKKALIGSNIKDILQIIKIFTLKLNCTIETY